MDAVVAVRTGRGGHTHDNVLEVQLLGSQDAWLEAGDKAIEEIKEVCRLGAGSERWKCITLFSLGMRESYHTHCNRNTYGG